MQCHQVQCNIPALIFGKRSFAFENLVCQLLYGESAPFAEVLYFFANLLIDVVHRVGQLLRRGDVS
ncbi:hypothetical protein D3C74_493190 [compost metagenome]